MAPPAKVALDARLRDLMAATEAKQAVVFDDVGLVWCVVPFPSAAEREVLFGLIKRCLEPLQPPLRRGGKLDRTVRAEGTAFHVKSFAATYVLGLFFDGEPGELLVRRKVKEALPQIEALTLALPPPDGPDAMSGRAAKGAG